MVFEIVVFDLDGVLVDTISSWVWIHNHFGVNNDASLVAYEKGEIDDSEFMRRDIALWHDKKSDMHINDVKNILSKVPIMSGAQETITLLRRNGIKIAIVSAGLEILAKRVSMETGGIDYIVANGLALDKNGYLLGEGILRVELMDKATPLLKLLNELDIDPQCCVSVGNSYIDVPMFKVSGLGIAFNSYGDIVKRNANIVVEKKDLREILKYVLE